jgi:phage baseplate assembly protein W
MLLYKQFSVLTGGKEYLIGGNFQWDWGVQANSVELVLSDVFNILCTPYGTQPLLRTFGLAQSWIDQPGSQGLMQGKIAALLAVSLWEPRAKLKNMQFVLNPSDIMGGRYSLHLGIEVDLTQELQTLFFAPPAPQPVWVLDAPFDGTYPTAQQETITI